MAEPRELHPAFRHREYLFRRGVFNVYGGAFHVYDTNGNLAFYAKRNVSKVMRPEFLVYSEGIQKEEFLSIETPKILEGDTTHNVHDTTTGKTVGLIRRKTVKSIIKDEWVFLSNEGEEVGRLTERNVSGALFARVVSFIPVIGDIISIPKRFVIVSANDIEVVQIRQHFAPLERKYSMTMVELEPSIDPRLLIAAGILLTGL
ncbi:hypothetical protein M1N46_02080 [Dehalococcoidia bacterium]|nr:hypothetical protein [Dehalococcoidia bacterium]